MRDWLRARGSFFKGAAGAICAMIAAALLIHFATLYISLLKLIAFHNQYADKIQKLP